jgi:hypothetical protein
MAAVAENREMTTMKSSYRIAYGDIHNHNAHGYGQGSIERSIDIARSHLDFYAFTGHSSWHDLAVGQDDRFSHFTKGFARLAATWGRVQDAIAAANQDGEFAVFLGFEWHSNYYGDQCVIFPDDQKPMSYAQDFDELQTFCRAHGALMLPHHVAYPRGVRGANWDVFDPELSPVVEIFSMHGCSETDRSPYPMKLGSPGGRSTDNTIAAALGRGLRFGFTASTDSHRGFPGAWGEGVMAALVDKVDRASVWDAIQNRRTYALTGDRIELGFEVDGAVMGSVLSNRSAAEVSFDVSARDEIALIEIIKNNEVISSFVPPQPVDGINWNETVQLRFEWGWGPWGELDTPRMIDWSFSLKVNDGTLLGHYPCLASHPFDETRRHRLNADGGTLAVTSYTSRSGAFNGNPNQAVVLELNAKPDDQVELLLEAPCKLQKSIALRDLAARSFEMNTGDYPSESFQFHRLIPLQLSKMSRSVTVEFYDQPSFVYLRVTQRNGQMAWSSPVFIEGRDRE